MIEKDLNPLASNDDKNTNAKKGVEGSVIDDKKDIMLAYTANDLDEKKNDLTQDTNKEKAVNKTNILHISNDKEKKAYQNNIEDVFMALERAMPKELDLRNNAFPHPRTWLGPRFTAAWGLPIFLINKTRALISASNPVREFYQSDYSISNYETIYTSSKKAFENKNPIRFFGARFMTIWVLPLAITGTVMEFLFISPITGAKPFG